MKISINIFRILAATMLVLVIVKLCYAFLFDFQEKDDYYSNLKLNYNSMTDNFRNKVYYENLYHELIQERNFPGISSYLKQEDILKLLNENILSSNINLSNINFSNTFISSTEKSEDENHNESENNSTIEIISVNIEFNSNYTNMLNFIDNLQNNPTNMSITNIVVNFSGDYAYATMDINFYSIAPKILPLK